MRSLEQLRQYYYQQLKDLYNLPFNELSTDQLKKINKSIDFKIWKFFHNKPPAVTVIKRPAKY